MLGVYENFPEKIHRTASFKIQVSNKTAQHSLIGTFQRLNNGTLSLEAVAGPSIPQCTVSFELGIAEDNNFNYLNSEETNRLQKIISKEPFQTMDFLCAIRYHKTQKERRISMRFDYYMLRFAFSKDTLEIRIFHERGPRYVAPEDIINLIARRVNETSSKKMLNALGGP